MSVELSFTLVAGFHISISMYFHDFSVSVSYLSSQFLKNYFFREREGRAEGDGEGEFQTGSTPSVEPDMGLNLTIPRS